MAEFGLLGQNLKYSYSKKIHESYGLYEYDLFQVEPDKLEDFFQKRKWHGINVTIPYKKSVMQYCDEITAIAKRIGAVNTIFERDGKLVGDNTDYYGFLHTLNLTGVKVIGKKVLILGRGGAAKCVATVMKEKKSNEIWQTSRDDLANLSKFAEAQIIVNATPLGTALTEHEGKSPCNLEDFKKADLVIDLVYNPEETPLLKQAKKLGIKHIGGMEMLKHQAEKSAHRFMKSKNIILIGMPGSGKSHIGRVLAAKSGRNFLDTDGEVKSTTGQYAEEIIKQQGLPAFRELEYQMLNKLAKEENAVISTGGGIATYEPSFEYLSNGCVPDKSRSDSIIVWIERDIDKLGRKHRPLSKDLAELYEERAPLYEALADIIVYNNGSPEDCVSEIKRMCKI